jgi:hypothetical protein
MAHRIGVDQHGEGPALVRNRLIGGVTTEWTLFLDDDDLLMPHYVATVERYFTDADVVYTDWVVSGAVDPQPLDRFDPELLQIRNFIPVTACVRTSVLREVGGFPDARYEDHELWKALYNQGYRFRHVPVVAWHYRRRAGSRTDAALRVA